MSKRQIRRTLNLFCPEWIDLFVVLLRTPRSHAQKEYEIMSTKKQAKPKSEAVVPRIVWFEVPADNPDRAKKFYRDLFGWKIEKFPAAVQEYWHIDTGGSDDVPDGGLMKRQSPEQRITNYIAVDS